MDSELSDEKGTAVAPASPVFHAFDAFPLVGDLSSMRHQVFTSYDITDMEQGALFYDLMTVGGGKPEDHTNMVLDIIHVSAWPITFVKEKTGEQVETWSVVLGTVDGKLVHFKSTGILRSLIPLMIVRGKPPYKTPIKMKLIRKATSEGKSMYVLERVGEWKNPNPLPKKK